MSGVIFQDDEKARTVMDYQPKKLAVAISAQAKNFIMSQPKETTVNFRISDLVAQQTGIQELEHQAVEKRIEQKALERLKEIQEDAYKEAYDLGMDEGRQKGFTEAKELIAQRLTHLNSIIEKLSRIKVDILQRNEIQIVDLLYHMASSVAMFEVQKNNERIIPVLKQAMESLQKDETMLIKVSDSDKESIEKLKEISGQEFEFLNRSKFESSVSIKPGGCIIETNYGLIDATLEERIAKLLRAIEDTKPNVKRDEFE